MRSLKKKRKIQEKKKKIQQKLYWLFLIAIVLYVLFGTQYNFIHYWQTKTANKQLKTNLTKFAEENKKLKEQIEELRTDPQAIERIARENYGMQKEGERVILFLEEGD